MIALDDQRSIFNNTVTEQTTFENNISRLCLSATIEFPKRVKQGNASRNDCNLLIKDLSKDKKPAADISLVSPTTNKNVKKLPYMNYKVQQQNLDTDSSQMGVDSSAYLKKLMSPNRKKETNNNGGRTTVQSSENSCGYYLPGITK